MLACDTERATNGAQQGTLPSISFTQSGEVRNSALNELVRTLRSVASKLKLPFSNHAESALLVIESISKNVDSNLHNHNLTKLTELFEASIKPSLDKCNLAPEETADIIDSHVNNLRVCYYRNQIDIKKDQMTPSEATQSLHKAFKTNVKQLQTTLKILGEIIPKSMHDDQCTIVRHRDSSPFKIDITKIKSTRDLVNELYTTKDIIRNLNFLDKSTKDRLEDLFSKIIDSHSTNQIINSDSEAISQVASLKRCVDNILSINRSIRDCRVALHDPQVQPENRKYVNEEIGYLNTLFARAIIFIDSPELNKNALTTLFIITSEVNLWGHLLREVSLQEDEQENALTALSITTLNFYMWDHLFREIFLEDEEVQICKKSIRGIKDKLDLILLGAEDQKRSPKNQLLCNMAYLNKLCSIPMQKC
jgi:hypothetical protein